MLFDTHAHLNDAQYTDDLDEVISRAKANQVGYILTASSDIASSVENITLTQKYSIFTLQSGYTRIMRLIITTASYRCLRNLHLTQK